MTSREHIAARSAQLFAERTHWDTVRARATLELQQLEPPSPAYTSNAEEAIKARLATASYELDRIAQELNRLEREREKQALADAIERDARREEMLKEADRRVAEAVEKERDTKEEFARQDRDKLDALQKEERQKADELQKERETKDSFEKQDREKAELLAKDEQAKAEVAEKDRQDKELVEKQEQQKREALEQQEQRAREDEQR